MSAAEREGAHPSLNLENLRKQAKQYVRWHRERRWTVAEVIRDTLHRYAHLSDVQILEATFKLADAQELVARRAGFDDWTLLVAAIRGGAENPGGRTGHAAARTRVLVARPFVFVRSVSAACAYYVDRLGFALAFDYGSPPFYAEVERDGVRLCIRYTRDALVDASVARREVDIILASFEVTDARALYQELRHAGVVFAQPLRVEPYGTRGFIVEDPDGNRLAFFDRYGVTGQPAVRGSPPGS